MVEIYPPTFKLFLADIPSQGLASTVEKSPSITLSRKATVKELKSTLLNAFDLSLNKTFQLYQLDISTQSHIGSSPIISTSALQNAILIDINDEEKTLSDLSLNSSDLVIDLRTPKQKEDDDRKLKSDDFSFDVKSINTSSTTDSGGFGSPSWLLKSTSSSKQKGVCGLNNLGNTCFMNSALQCLSNTKLLTEWFLAGNYKKDLNPDNPLGMNGEVAENYGSLIEKLWSGSTSSIAPRDFKYTISRFNPQFTGYQQHDSQELLAFLLDGLHEDLNRILKKPYIEMPDFDDMKDEEIAKTSWDYHKARNDSIIVDLFQGQFKSRLTCNVCKKISVTFDPFMYLSLPLPVQKKTKLEIVYVPYDPSQPPQRIIITIEKDSSVKKLKNMVASQFNVEDSNNLFVVEIFSSKFYKIFLDYEPVGTIRKSDIIYVYQLPGLPPAPQQNSRYTYGKGRNLYGKSTDDDKEEEEFDGEKWIIFPVYCAASPENDNNSQSYEQFGGPMLLATQAKDATDPDKIYKLIAKHVERYTMMKLFEEVKEPLESTSITPSNTKLDSIENDNKNIANNKDDDIEIKEVDDNYMEVDTVSKPIKTAAAVTAAGGRRLEPIANLFSMKIFTGTSYGMDDIIPTQISSWKSGQNEDLRERAEKEHQQRIAYEKAQKKNNENDESSSHDNGIKLSNKNKNSRMDEDDDDTVDDILENSNNNIDDKYIKTSEKPISGNNKTEKADDDLDEYENDIVTDVETEWNKDMSMSLDDNNSDNSSMIVETSKHHKFMDSSPSPSPPPSTYGPSPPLRCPPRTIIRQGEGVIIDWKLKKAQELFGVSKSSSSSSSYSSSNRSVVNEEAWDDIEDLGDPNAEADKKERDKKITLMDCLDEFTKEELLSEEDLWYCPRCKDHQRASKKFDIWNLPEIMVVHLKRFSHTRTLRDKLDIFIDFPMESLDMTDRVLSIKNPSEVAEEDRLIYDLYAVDNHFGGLGGGHYTAYGQNFQDGSWYNFDDSHVSKVEASDAKTNAAYLLFYKRRRKNLDTAEHQTVIEKEESEL
ncbi:unnamed protein product [Cunninghamella blakesleeana]